MPEPAKVKVAGNLGQFEDYFGVENVTDVSLTDSDTDPDNQWVSVTEAAKFLGITERTIWRRIKKGKLESKQVDFRTYVTVGGPDAVPTEPDSNTDEKPLVSVGMSDPELKLLDMVSDLTNKLMAAAGRNGYLEAQLHAKEETVKLLEDKQVKAEKDSVVLHDIQRAYAALEDEHHVLEGKNREFQLELERYSDLAKRSTWKKFSDWMIGRK